MYENERLNKIMSTRKKLQGKRHAPTITDVAEASGFAISTVSHVINGTATISLETKQKILKTIKSMNFKPNTLARGLREGETKLIGMVVPDITIEFYSKFAKGVIDSLYKEGYTAILCGTQYDFKREIKEVDALIQRRIDGLIFVGGNEDDEYILGLKNNGVPIVLADRSIPGSSISSVEFDNVMAMKNIVTSLALKGYKKIGYITEPVIWTNLKDRYMGYRLGLIENNIVLDESFVFIDERLRLDKINNSYILMKEIIANCISNSAKLPEVFITTSDLIAAGAINALRESGFDVPGDLGITGVDDILVAAYLTPSLTTIRQDIEQMGVACSELILNIIKEQDVKPKRILLESQLILRNSY